MKKFEIITEIHASPDRVWQVISEVERWSEWTPTVTSIKIKEGSPLGVGSHLIIRQPKLFPATWKIIEIEKGRGFKSINSHLFVQVTAGHYLEPSHKGTKLILSLQFTGLLGPVVARLSHKLNERYLFLEAKGLKEFCENSVPR